MSKTQKWICTTISALIGTVIVSIITWDWSWFVLRWLTSIIPTHILKYFLFDRKSQKKKQESEQRKIKSYSVSEYFARTEKAALEILDEQEPVDYTIILWWGFDGLRLKDGKLEWISRKTPVYVDVGAGINNAPYIPPVVKGYTIGMGEDPDDFPKQTLELQHVYRFDEMQSTQAQINALKMQNAALLIQAAQCAQINALQNQIFNSCCNGAGLITKS